MKPEIVLVCATALVIALLWFWQGRYVAFSASSNDIVLAIIVDRWTGCMARYRGDKTQWRCPVDRSPALDFSASGVPAGEIDAFLESDRPVSDTTKLEEFRKKYPEYNDLSDEELAQALHREYYSDIPYEDFLRRIGYRSRQNPFDQFDKEQ